MTPVTVGELIKALEKFPEDMEVHCHAMSEDDDWSEPFHVADTIRRDMHEQSLYPYQHYEIVDILFNNL